MERFESATTISPYQLHTGLATDEYMYSTPQYSSWATSPTNSGEGRSSYQQGHNSGYGAVGQALHLPPAGREARGEECDLAGVGAQFDGKTFPEHTHVAGFNADADVME